MPKIIPPFSSADDRRYRFLRVFDEYYGSRGGTIGLYVEGGVSPYTWEVTGTDFTLGAAETDDQENYVTVAADAVLDNTETVTVTDAAANSVTITVCTCNPYDCCDDADYEFTFGETPDAPPEPGQKVKFTVTGGCPRYKWEIYATEPVGQEEYYQFYRTYTNTKTNFVFALEGASATMLAVKVTDDCYGITGELVYETTGYDEDYCDDEGYSFTMDWDSTPVAIDPGGSIYVVANGGEPPYTWGITGTGFSFDDEVTLTPVNYLNAENETCGAGLDSGATFTITDNCGTELTGKVRNTDGKWVDKGSTWRSDFNWNETCGGNVTSAGGTRCRIDYIEGNGLRRWRYSDYGNLGHKDCAKLDTPPCSWYAVEHPEGYEGDIDLEDGPCPGPGYCGSGWDAECVAHDAATPYGVYQRVELQGWECSGTNAATC